MNTPVCPKCKQEDSIGQMDTVPGYAMIQEVEDDGTIVWEGTTELEWNNQQPQHSPPQFMCTTCSATFPSLNTCLGLPEDNEKTP